VSERWTKALAVVSSVRQDEFEEVCMEAVEPGCAVVIRRDVLRVRVRDPAQEVVLLLALPCDLGQRCRVAPGRYILPPGAAPLVYEAVSRLGIGAGIVPTAVFDMELLDGALDAQRAALLRRGPTFGPTYPRFEIG